MLTELRIKNFAIIESLTLPLARGFNVLSGETGAGKSIIVGALGLLLGDRGERRRHSHGRRSRDRRRRVRRRAIVPRFGTRSTTAASKSTTRSVVLKREVAAGRDARMDQRHAGQRGDARRHRPAARERARPARGANAARSRIAAPHSRRLRRRDDAGRAGSRSARHAGAVIREIADLAEAPRARPRSAPTTCGMSCSEIGDAKLVEGEDASARGRSAPVRER